MCTIQQDPGKFEGETCITHLAHTWSMSGAEDETIWDELDRLIDRFHGPFTHLTYDDKSVLCTECHNDLLQASTVTFWQDDNGFAYSEVN